MMMIDLPQKFTPHKTKLYKLKEYTMKLEEGKLK